MVLYQAVQIVHGNAFTGHDRLGDLFLACTRLVFSAITSRLPACRIGVMVAQISLACGACLRIVTSNSGNASGIPLRCSPSRAGRC